MSVYKPCDIRGPISELSPELYRSWGRSLGNMIDPGEAMVVGGDVRQTTPAFKTALVKGISETGRQVYDLGIVPTPVVCFARAELQCAGCAIVTASHSPPDINGLKWMIGLEPPSPEMVQQLAREAARRAAHVAPRAPGNIIKIDIVKPYRDWLTSRWSVEPHAVNASVIVDPGNGCWAGLAVPLMQHVFPGIRFEGIHDVRDGSFPGRNPDCSRPEFLAALSSRVIETAADLGIAFDGDGDRVAFVDDEGVALTSEQATWTVLESFAEKLRGRAFVYDIKFSDRIRDAAAVKGARAIVERSGHAFIRSRMIRERAILGAEISGHYFFEELGGGDDGLFAGLHMLAFLGQAGSKLSMFRRNAPRVHISPDLRVRVDPSQRGALIQRIKKAFSGFHLLLVDGVRVDFNDGWALARSSVTEPTLTFRFEGNSPEALDSVVKRFCNHLPELGPVLRELYVRGKSGTNSDNA